MGSFVQCVKIFRWKSREELCLMTLKSDARFEEKLTLGSKNDMRNLVNFNGSKSEVASLKICTLMCYFCGKYVMFEPKQYRGIMCDSTEE